MTTLDSELLESVEKDYFDDPRVMALVDRFRFAQSEPLQEPLEWECKAGGLKRLTQRQYESQPDNIKRHYTRVEPVAWWLPCTPPHYYVPLLIHSSQPPAPLTPAEAKSLGWKPIFPAPPKLDKGPVVAQISPNVNSAIEEWKQLGGEIIRNEPPSAQLPPLPKNLHSLAGNLWASICYWADAEPGAEAGEAAEQINKALDAELLAYAKEALRLNGVNV